MTGAAADSSEQPADATTVAFAALMQESDQALPLDQAALLLAKGIVYPDLELTAALDTLDDLAARLRQQLRNEQNPWVIAEALQHFLGHDMGFRGPDSLNDESYYDDRNSYLNDILGRRIGIPIGLSLVYLEVARRIDFPMVGVGMPLHFVVKYSLGPAPDEGIFLDPFYGGALLTAHDLEQRFLGQFGRQYSFATHYLGAVTKKQLLTRLLNNLRGVYLGRQRLTSALRVLEYLLLIAPWNLEALRDHGLLALRIGDYPQAIADLDTYTQFATNDPHLPAIRGHLEELRQRFSLEGDMA